MVFANKASEQRLLQMAVGNVLDRPPAVTVSLRDRRVAVFLRRQPGYTVDFAR